jgi:hypothetical protein
LKELIDVKASLEVAVLMVQLLGFPIAALSIYLAYRSYKSSRDVQVALSLSESFRTRWEEGWRKSLNAIAEAQETDKKSDPSHEEQLTNMLNWIDWVGRLMETGVLPKNMTLLATIEAPLVRAIQISRSRIEKDIADKGPNHWKGILTIARESGVEWARRT